MATVAATVGAVLAGGAMLSAAHADTPAGKAPGYVKGKVTASPHLAIRSKPTTKSFREGYYNKGTVLALKCYVKGQGVFGNTTWYRLDPTHNGNWDGVGYVSAHYIKLLGAKPHHC
ncbi:SH3 domain-containing protein [Actinomadura violacea]|uniref:SH3 domain-containing protein n=1 Tax=Actinomadura violacea TaxID=2819934 RepID=A0ABS3SB93_9ACTN|nr:SH3 domain-containing protein [Actinomadura violacea]MBO2465475.1 SH3 domain-containing protein [Actinomadura violacea]